MDQLVSPDPLALVLFAVGWASGWLLLWHRRPLPAAGGPRPSVAVVVPARNEAGSIGELVSALVAQLEPGDELVVVDDHSDDETADIARAAGARIVRPDPPPRGWLGKPNACWAGASATTAPVLLFIDADVAPQPDLVERVAAAITATPDHVVTMQPWHRTGAPGEQLSLLANVVALMGSGAFAIGTDGSSNVAFGPVLALTRTSYTRIGGHGAPAARSSPVEDIELARAMGGARVFGAVQDTSFRMYPGGVRDLVLGWSRTVAAGARATPWPVALAVVGWVWSLAGGWLASPLVYPLSALQVWVLGRRAGSIHPLTAALFPVLVVVFVVVLLRAVALRLLGRTTPWKGRPIAPG